MIYNPIWWCQYRLGWAYSVVTGSCFYSYRLVGPIVLSRVASPLHIGWAYSVVTGSRFSSYSNYSITSICLIRIHQFLEEEKKISDRDTQHELRNANDYQIPPAKLTFFTRFPLHTLPKTRNNAGIISCYSNPTTFKIALYDELLNGNKGEYYIVQCKRWANHNDDPFCKCKFCSVGNDSIEMALDYYK